MPDATFYFDFNSPYAYLASERIDDLIPNAEWKPIPLAFIFAQIGKVPWSLSDERPKGVAEVERRVAERGLPPVKWSEGWPRETWSLAPLRAALYADDQGRLREFTHAAYRQFFVAGAPLGEIENLRTAATEAGLDPDDVEQAIQQDAIKERLKANTEEALARGVTGVPTVAIGDQLFWGDDRLEEAAAAVAGDSGAAD